MNPSMMQQLARTRADDLCRAAAASGSHHGGRSPGATIPPRPVTRLLGELLIRTGRRLAGPEVPASGIRPRLALPGPGHAAHDC